MKGTNLGLIVMQLNVNTAQNIYNKITQFYLDFFE